jgi:hypothetical protein
MKSSLPKSMVRVCAPMRSRRWSIVGGVFSLLQSMPHRSKCGHGRRESCVPKSVLVSTSKTQFSPTTFLFLVLGFLGLSVHINKIARWELSLPPLSFFRKKSSPTTLLTLLGRCCSCSCLKYPRTTSAYH